MRTENSSERFVITVLAFGYSAVCFITTGDFLFWCLMLFASVPPFILSWRYKYLKAAAEYRRELASFREEEVR